MTSDKFVLHRHDRSSFVFAATMHPSYLSKIDKTVNSSRNACDHLIQNTSNLTLSYPTTDSLRSTLFGNSFSTYFDSGHVEELGNQGIRILSPCLPNPTKESGNNNNTMLLAY